VGPIPATVSNVIWAEVALLIPALGGVLIAICTLLAVMMSILAHAK
jgi:hypothetical protein